MAAAVGVFGQPQRYRDSLFTIWGVGRAYWFFNVSNTSSSAFKTGERFFDGTFI